MDHSIAAKYAARPAARFVRPSTRVRERRLGLRPSGSFHGAGRPVDRAARSRGRAARPAAGQLAGDPPGRHEAPPQRSTAPAGGHGVGPVRASRRGPPSGRRVGAVARLRTSTATSAGGIVVRYESGQPWLVVGSRRRERDGRTWTLPKGTPHAGESREETALREVEEETGLAGPHHRAARLHRVLVRPVRDAHPQDRPLLPDGADRRRPGPARPRVRRGPLDPVRPGRRRC